MEIVFFPWYGRSICEDLAHNLVPYKWASIALGLSAYPPILLVVVKAYFVGASPILTMSILLDKQAHNTFGARYGSAARLSNILGQ
jgi:hypothetical protein